MAIPHPNLTPTLTPTPTLTLGVTLTLVLATLGRLVEPKIFGLILYFGLPFRMQPINYKCDKCVNWLIYCDQEPLWLLTHRR